MLRANSRLITVLERGGDNVAIVLSFFAAYFGRDALTFWNDVRGWGLPFSGRSLAPIGEYSIVLLGALILYNLFLPLFGAYDRMRLGGSFRVLRASMMTSTLVFIGIAAQLFALKADLSRAVLVLFCVFAGILIAVERHFMVKFLRYWLRRKIHLRNIIITGMGLQANSLAKMIHSRPELGIHLVGFALLGERPGEAEESSVVYRANLALMNDLPAKEIILGNWALEGALRQYAVDEVIFTDIAREIEQVEEMILVCGELGVRTTLAADLFSFGIVRSDVSYFGNMPLIHYQPPPGDRWELALKRSIDLVLSGVSLVVLAPLFGAIALLVKLSSPGPVIFKQKRVGLNGREFSLYKFRSMREDAERYLTELRAKNEMTGPAFKMKSDPRITPIGRILRRFSLDELPQLWNVFRGDMSLVGPRPPVPTEVDQYRRTYRRRLSMRPGLTCTWQVSGRNEISDFESWMKLDLDYIDNWSLFRDLAILMKTIPTVIRGTGAR